MTDSNSNMIMPVAPTGFGGGFGNSFGGDWGWIILLLLIAGGGWGFGGFGGGVGGFAADGAMLYPWMNQANLTSEGFQNQLMNDNITSIRDNVYGLSNQLCTGFAGVNASVNGAQNAIAQQLYTNQIADLERSYASQTAQTAGMNSIAMNLQNCCCENRANIADLKYTVATENCADRQALNEGVRDIIASNTAQTQAIIDKLCALELDGYKRENDNLRSQLNMATIRESQTAQNAFITQGFANEVDALYNRLNNCPVGTVPVYGKTPIFSCNGNNSCCGCGCSGNF